MRRTAMKDDHNHSVTLVTGPSGAGRSTAIRALEDLGHEAIDNMPLRLLAPLLKGTPQERPLALGFDTRNRDFNTNALLDVIHKLTARPDVDAKVLYLDASKESLLRRFSETRRRHPLAPDESPAEGIIRDFDLLGPIKNHADLIIDTTDKSPHDLKQTIADWIGGNGKKTLSVSVQSFSYKRGMPRGLDMVFDVRFLKNPYWDQSLRPLNGRNKAVQAYVSSDDRFTPFLTYLNALLDVLLPGFFAEGKSHLSIGFGCTGGQHRSVTMTEILAPILSEKGWNVSIRHRELDRNAPSAKGAAA
jgi:UPF0042 nucleotide-binding protein